MVPSKQKAAVNLYLLLVLAIFTFGVGGYFTYKYGLNQTEVVTKPLIINPDDPVDDDTTATFECPETKILDCSPCTGPVCPEFFPQYCSKGSTQYNFIIENCPDVEIVGID
jgi:hypothetical protein